MSNSSIWPTDRTLSGATTLGQSRPESNGNEEGLHVSQSSRAGASLSDGLMSYSVHSFERGVLPLSRDAVNVFYSHNRQGWESLESHYQPINQFFLDAKNSGVLKLTNPSKAFLVGFQFLCLMAYQPPCFIWCQSHPCRKYSRDSIWPKIDEITRFIPFPRELVRKWT